ncbi:unnamed protein product [Orchesella dallaii]|uniref:SHSP domain-containing protein n=1 Tax=Orchesella dallaii TaxID=48710 RepID=A0ABP1RD03_9HEXA
MFYKIVENPIRSFFDNEEDTRFVSGLERLVDFEPFRVPVGVFTIKGRPRHGNQQHLQRQTSLKRKQCSCSCNCHDETKIPASSSSNSNMESKDVKSQYQSDKKAEVIPAPEPEPKKTKFEIKLNIDQRYKPDEIKVKLDNDNRSLVVEGTHQETKDDNNCCSKVNTQMYHKFILPKDVDVEALTCDMNEQGLMVISAPRKLPELNMPYEKVIPITLASQNGEEKQMEDRISNKDPGKENESQVLQKEELLQKIEEH